MKEQSEYDRMFLVSESRNIYVELTDLIPEMMFIEGISEEEAVEYFMEGMKGTRFAKFPASTPTKKIRKWITEDMGLTW